MGKAEEIKKQEAEQEAHIWCTSCGRILPEDSVYCEFCGSRVEREISRVLPDSRKQFEKQEEGSIGCLKHLEWKKAAAAGMIAAGGLVLFAVWASGRQAGEDFQPLLGYIKDNSLFVLEENGEAGEISEACLRDWKNREQLRLSNAKEWIPAYSEKKEILWYPEQAGDGAFSLMSLYNKKEQKADSGAVSVQTAGETAAYEKSSGGLYVYTQGSKKKLAADISFYKLGAEGDYLIWQEEHPDQTMGLYGISLDKKGRLAEEELLEKDAKLLGASEDLKSILYKKEGEIWLLENHSEKRRLAQNVNQVFLTGIAEKTLFFTRQENGGESLYVLSGEQAGKQVTEQLLDPEFLFLIHEEDGILTYKASGEDGEEIRIAGEEKSAALDCDPNLEITFTVSGDYGWYLAPPEPGMEQSLYRVSLDPGQFGSAEEAAQNADRFCGQYEGIPFCLSSVHDQTGDLYFGEQAVACDVKIDSVCLRRNQKGQETGIYFLSDYDVQTESGILTSYLAKTGETESVDDNVSGYIASPDTVLYFTDYEPSRGRAVLNSYQNGTATEIDTDVWAAYMRSGDTAVFTRQNQIHGIE